MSDMARLIEPVLPGLRRYARALVRDAASADDLVQDALERAVSRWGQRRGDGETRPWLFAILHNLAISRLRQAARRGPHVAYEETAPGALGLPPTQEQGLLQGEVLAALATLPEEHRSVLLLVGVEDLSYAEAARVLGVPVGTVMSRLSRARERLRLAAMGGPAAASRPALRRVK